MLLLPIHAEHDGDRFGQLGNVFAERYDLEFMAAGGAPFVGYDYLLLGDDQGITCVAMDVESCSVDLPPSPGSVGHEPVEVLVLVANVAEPEFDAGAIARHGLAR